LLKYYFYDISVANHLFGSLAMMGYEGDVQPKLFYHQINLDQRVPRDHLLRRIEEKIDFDFI